MSRALLATVALVATLTLTACKEEVDTEGCQDASGNVRSGTVASKYVNAENGNWTLEVRCGSGPGERYYVVWPPDDGDPRRQVGPPGWEDVEVGDPYRP